MEDATSLFPPQPSHKENYGKTSRVKMRIRIKEAKITCGSAFILEYRLRFKTYRVLSLPDLNLM